MKRLILTSAVVAAALAWARPGSGQVDGPLLAVSPCTEVLTRGALGRTDNPDGTRTFTQRFRAFCRRGSGLDNSCLASVVWQLMEQDATLPRIWAVWPKYPGCVPFPPIPCTKVFSTGLSNQTPRLPRGHYKMQTFFYPYPCGTFGYPTTQVSTDEFTVN
jgi:hypothetical protein